MVEALADIDVTERMAGIHRTLVGPRGADNGSFFNCDDQPSAC